MRAGPKPAVNPEPLDLQWLPRNRAARAIAFIEAYLIVPKGKGAGKPVRLRSWQRRIIRRVLAPGVRQAVVAIPRGNGKSALASMLALWGLFDGPAGAQVLVVASDLRQCGIVFGAARRMVELNPLLAERVQVFQDHLYLPHTDGTVAILPADPASLQGWDPTLVVLDELHVVSDPVYEALALAAGKRDRSLLLAISTPADSRDSVMWRLVTYGRDHPEDKAFRLVEFMAPDGCAVDDRRAWRKANPALGDFLAEDGLAAALKTTREGPFRQYRLGQWVGATASWLPWGAWDDRAASERRVEPGERIVLGFDGSASGDSTALVGCTLEGHVFVIGLWEHPGDADDGWRVPRHEVDGAVHAAFDRWEVVELACDPWGWRSEIEAWSARYPRRVIEWPTNVISRIAPATDRAFQAVMEGTLTHDGDEHLRRHVGNCTVKSTPHGAAVIKGSRTQKIDAAVAGIVAFDRAAWHAAHPARRKRVASF